MADLFLNGIGKTMDAMVAYNDKFAADAVKEAQAAYAVARGLTVGLLIAAIVIGALFSVFITRSITGPLSQLSGRLDSLRGVCVTNLAAAIEAMEHGDLTVKVQTGTAPLSMDTRDEFGALARTFNGMLDQVKSMIGSFSQSQASLSEIVRGLQGSATQIASASATLASAPSRSARRPRRSPPPCRRWPPPATSRPVGRARSPRAAPARRPPSPRAPR
jgi:methyl-accepting chemotaxis protein